MMRSKTKSMIAAGSLMLAVVSVGPASAQNYDGGGLLRFGPFLQGAFTNFDVESSTGSGTGSASLDRIGFGAAFGYDHRFNTMILGIEADGSTNNGQDAIGRDTYATDYFATFRGRVGTFVRPDLLFYGTFGLALTGVEYKAAGENANGLNSIAKQLQTLAGYTAGLGLEYDWHGMLVFGEYLYANFESWEVGGVGGRLTIEPDTHLLRLGVKFKIGHDHYHDPYRSTTYK